LSDPRPSPGKIVNKLPSKPFSGEVFRHVYEGKGGTDSSRSKIAGGRWNPIREFEALYLALSEEGTVGEFIRYVGYYKSLAPDDALTREIVRVKVHVRKILDLTDPKIRASLGVTQEELRGGRNQWDEITWPIARAVFAAGFEGILVPSAANGWVNLVLFPENLLPGSSVVEKGRRKMKAEKKTGRHPPASG